MPKPNFHLLVGEDTFSMLEEVKRWKTAFLEKYGNTDLEEFDGDAQINQIANSLGTQAFLSEKRLVILKNFLSSQKAEISIKLLPALEKLPDDTFLLMMESSPDKRTTAFKKISALSTNRLFLRPKGPQLGNWIMRRAQSFGGQINSETASYLSSLVGDDLFLLNNEVQKLTLLAQNKAITIEMIDAITANGVQKSIFTMTDALARKDNSLTLRTIRELQRQGEEAPFLFSMVTRQFRLLLEMKALSEKGKSPSQIARDMQAHPFVVENTLRYTRNFTVAKLKKALKDLLELDKRLKTGLIPLKPREEDQYLLALERILLAV